MEIMNLNTCYLFEFFITRDNKLSYVNVKKLPVFQKTADSSNDDPPSQQKITAEENEKVSMPSGGGENNYMRLLVVSQCWGLCKPNDVVKKIENTLTQQKKSNT